MPTRKCSVLLIPVLLIVICHNLGFFTFDVDERGGADASSSQAPGYQEIYQQTQDRIPMCTADERRESLRDYCQTNAQESNKTVRQKVYRLIVDDIHKVLVCLHAKVGCSTWKTILANNTSYYPLPVDVGIHADLLAYNLSFLHDETMYSDDDIKYRLDNYYKIMVVRHPYDRLNSFFSQKFVHGSGVANHSLGYAVMNAYYRDTLPIAQRKAGNISFSDIVHWIEDGNVDSHFDGPYHKKCHPCFINYDYVVKLESQKRDSDFIIRHKLSGQGLGTARNVDSSNHTADQNPLLNDGKKLSLFNNLTPHQTQFMRDRLQPDLDMFGYSYDEHTHLAKCLYKDKECC